MSTTRTLLIDADDTLWENNIYFEQVATAFVAELGKRGHVKDRIEQFFWQAEQRSIKVMGYGTKGFCYSLLDVVNELGANDLEAWIREKEHWIFHHPMELLTGVQETLPLLHSANRLILMTKGQSEEQLPKLERSGLGKFFHATEVVPEKSLETYKQVIVKHGLTPAQTWMIGNSPRSDINPAIAAGLGTVFIPYHTTWQHELEEITPDGGTIVLENFGQLAQHFA
jgi:putative hydrolase of the HAD superfamily